MMQIGHVSQHTSKLFVKPFCPVVQNVLKTCQNKVQRSSHATLRCTEHKRQGIQICQALQEESGMGDDFVESGIGSSSGIQILPVVALFWLLAQLPAGAEEIAQTDFSKGSFSTESYVVTLGLFLISLPGETLHCAIGLLWNNEFWSKMVDFYKRKWWPQWNSFECKTSDKPFDTTSMLWLVLCFWSWLSTTEWHVVLSLAPWYRVHLQRALNNLESFFLCWVRSIIKEHDSAIQSKLKVLWLFCWARWDATHLHMLSGPS